MAGLAAQEAHGKRLDASSQKRVIRDESPLVYKGLDLRDLYDGHVEGAKMNSAAKKTVLHFIVRFPPELIDVDAKHFNGSKTERQNMMLQQAVAFIEKTHGGDAVFAARLDRDEAGETIADVFAAPRYEKITKRTKPGHGKIWASATKFGKDLCDKHQSEIRRRHPKAKGRLTGPRHVGIALNIEWRSWFERVNELKLAPKVEKTDLSPDRLETEAFKRAKAEEERLAAISSDLDQREQAMADREKRLENIEAREEEVSERETFLKNMERNFQKTTRRMLNLLMMMGETLGISVPPEISGGLHTLEAEASERMQAWAISSSPPEEPFDDAGPGF
jgi:hypothetical protein